MSEEQKAALYSVPDKKGQKAKSEGVSTCIHVHVLAIVCIYSVRKYCIYMYIVCSRTMVCMYGKSTEGSPL